MNEIQKEIARYFAFKAKIPTPRNHKPKDDEKYQKQIFDALIDTLLHFGIRKIKRAWLQNCIKEEMKEGEGL